MHWRGLLVALNALSLGGGQSFRDPGRAGRVHAERLAEGEPCEGALCDAQRANQIALEPLEQ
jgi:hypothetical protein